MPPLTTTAELATAIRAPSMLTKTSPTGGKSEIGMDTEPPKLTDTSNAADVVTSGVGGSKKDTVKVSELSPSVMVNSTSTLEPAEAAAPKPGDTVAATEPRKLPTLSAFSHTCALVTATDAPVTGVVATIVMAAASHATDRSLSATERLPPYVGRLEPSVTAAVDAPRTKYAMEVVKDTLRTPFVAWMVTDTDEPDAATPVGTPMSSHTSLPVAAANSMDTASVLAPKVTLTEPASEASANGNEKKRNCAISASTALAHSLAGSERSDAAGASTVKSTSPALPGAPMSSIVSVTVPDTGSSGTLTSTLNAPAALSDTGVTGTTMSAPPSCSTEPPCEKVATTSDGDARKKPESDTSRTPPFQATELEPMMDAAAGSVGWRNVSTPVPTTSAPMRASRSTSPASVIEFGAENVIV
mmetsp:Transcript_2872/g.10188  ORF Transcript_2872/g.10188 Transcript_2872/m.10188 type:complete len:414 (-) Transcript_2872:56-1297(-)